MVVAVAQPFWQGGIARRGGIRQVRLGRMGINGPQLEPSGKDGQATRPLGLWCRPWGAATASLGTADQQEDPAAAPQQAIPRLGQPAAAVDAHTHQEVCGRLHQEYPQAAAADEHAVLALSLWLSMQQKADIDSSRCTQRSSVAVSAPQPMACVCVIVRLGAPHHRESGRCCGVCGNEGRRRQARTDSTL
eukprot:3811256-Prymnesium_polylepis.2